MQEEAQGTGHTPKGLTDTSKQPPQRLLHDHSPNHGKGAMSSHTGSGPREIHHPAESLSTCWVTKGHSSSLGLDELL